MQTTQTIIPSKSSKAKIIALGASSLLLTWSNILTFFAPIPLVVTSFVYGRRSHYLMGIVLLSVLIVLGNLVLQSHVPALVFTGVFLMSIFLGETLLRDWPPVKVWILAGVVMVGGIQVGTYSYFMSRNLTLENYVVETLEEHKKEISEIEKWWKTSDNQDAFMMLQLLSDPKLMAKEIKKQFLIISFVMPMLMLWFNLFLSLKMRRIFFQGLQKNRWDENTLLYFRVPFEGIYLLIGLLALSIFPEILDPVYAQYSKLGLWWIGTFYFVQGFGVMSAFLDKWGIRGFLRSFLVLIILIYGFVLPALIGVFDSWFDFRKKIKNKD